MSGPHAPGTANGPPGSPVGVEPSDPPMRDGETAHLAVHLAVQAAALLAVDPFALGGVRLRAAPGPARDAWLALLAELLPPGTPQRRVPLGAGDARLLGGLDLAATLRAGRPVEERGLLAAADGGVLVLAMAERIAPMAAARVTAMLDSGEVRLERDGLARRSAARAGVVALDEGIDDEAPPGALLERLALHLDLTDVRAAPAAGGCWPAAASSAGVAAARERVAHVSAADGVLEAVCATAMALGVHSLRASSLALRAARIAAALAGRVQVDEEDVALAACLVLAPRATVLPAPPADEDAPADEPEAHERTPEADARDAGESGDGEQQAPSGPMSERVLDAARAAIPPALLARLRVAAERAARTASRGRAGAPARGAAHGRPAGVRAGAPRGARLDVVETLRAAAPWQALRRPGAPAGAGARRVVVRPEDFRVTRFKQRSATTTVFAVDASGSQAMHRLAETKGAVELLLADCYVRRDRVALVAFRGAGAELLLPPTRSLARARRSLAGLPGGGGTPLAAGIDAALRVADAARRRGETPTVVLLTDGRGNVARDGSPGRERAAAEALDAARSLRAEGVRALLLDTARRPSDAARALADALGALYVPLPHADAATISGAVRAVAPAAARGAA